MLLRPKSVEEANAALQQCRIKSLDCTQMKLGDAGCIVLSEGLSHNTTLQTLLLWHQKISHDGLASIAPAISKLPALRELNFYRNRLATVGANKLAELLTRNCAPLQKLWLGDNSIQTFPSKLLGLTNLQRLHMNENKISRIPNELALSPSLQHVDLDHNFLSDLPELVFISGIKRLPGPRWDLLKIHLLKQLQIEEETRQRKLEEEEEEKRRQAELDKQKGEEENEEVEEA